MSVCNRRHSCLQPSGGRGPGITSRRTYGKTRFSVKAMRDATRSANSRELGNRTLTHDQPAAASRTTLLCLRAPGRFARGKFVARIAKRSARRDVLHRFYKSKAIPICFVPILLGKHVILLGHKMGRRLRPQTPAFFFVLMWIDGFARLNEPTSEVTHTIKLSGSCYCRDD
jgi:hypothetical protein